MIMMIGIAGSIGMSVISCNETNTKSEPTNVPTSGACRIIAIDSAHDRVIGDTSTIAITRNGFARPAIQICGLRSQNIFAKKNDLLFFTIDSNTSLSERKRLESFRLFSYHAN